MKDAEKVAKKQAKEKSTSNFNFELSNDDIERQQAVSESLAIFHASRKNKLHG